MDRVQRDQCRLLINLSEFQIPRLARREVGEEGKSEVSPPGEEGPASVSVAGLLPSSVLSPR